jgi:hypothetical protein
MAEDVRKLVGRNVRKGNPQAPAPALATKHLTPGALLYIFMDWRHSIEILAAATEAKLELKNICALMASP